jgi:protein involved in polysaccharide export with SLBB domain
MNNTPNRTLCRIAIIFLASWFSCHPAKAPAQQPSPQPSPSPAFHALPDDVIQPGDVLELFVVEDASYNGRYHVRKGGYIIVPAIGRISVAGKSPHDAEAQVSKALETTKLKHATVTLEKLEGGGIQTGPNNAALPSPPPFSVSVTGRVMHPGALPLKPGDQIGAYAAILKAGGFARFADTNKVYILRLSPDGTEVKIPVNIPAIQRNNAADVPLKVNDIVVVPEKFFSF